MNESTHYFKKVNHMLFIDQPKLFEISNLLFGKSENIQLNIDSKIISIKKFFEDEGKYRHSSAIDNNLINVIDAESCKVLCKEK